jgi:hypothetical protein
VIMELAARRHATFAVVSPHASGRRAVAATIQPRSPPSGAAKHPAPAQRTKGPGAADEDGVVFW